MKTYLRLLKYAQPLGQYIAPYFISSLLASIFGILNFALLQPLLEVLFNTDELKPMAAPVPNFGVDYLKDLFQYHLNQVMLLDGKIRALQYVCGIIILSVFLSNVFRYLSSRIIESMRGSTVSNLRSAVFNKILKLHLSFFNNERKGDLMARLTTDILEVEVSIGRAFSAVFKEIILLIGYFFTLFYQSFELTLFSLVVIPLSGGIIGILSKRLRERAIEVQSTMATILSLIEETFGGMRVVKAFNGENFIGNKFRNENETYFNVWRKMLFRQELASPMSEFLGVSVVAGILLYGGSMVLSGQSDLKAAGFIAYIVLFSQVTRPAKEISNAISGMQRGRASAERIFRLMDTPIEIEDAPNAIQVSEFKHDIALQNVTFAYQPGRDVLKNISFSIPKGKTIALVGSSGSGKSTIADLIPRFFDPTSGQILLDGTDVRQITQHSLRNLMGIVTQESILFNDTIYNNIAFGLKVTQAQIEEAARIANAHEFIMQTPDGYQSVIGDRGSKLSGGQRQRLSIARAILKNPPILLLDEATSALDTESEKLVQEALTHLMRNRTTLVIAHRLSTIQHADEILVLQQGQIIERGTHSELLEHEKSIYRKLSMLQGV
ncbi:MAG: ABC transporter ATP-binding protein [Siphonobacter sp.]